MKTFPCGGYPPDKQIVQTFQAGQIINIRFGNSNFGTPGQAPITPTSDQARHSGGLCEFSLSYDQGLTFGVFARYHGSCPDMFYDWPVKLPSNLPSCDSCILGKESTGVITGNKPCKWHLSHLLITPFFLSAWNWIDASALRPEFYMSCADIKIIGTAPAGGLPTELANSPIRFANMPGLLYFLAKGDGMGNVKGKGPDPAELQANLDGQTGGEDTSFKPIFPATAPVPAVRGHMRRRVRVRRLDGRGSIRRAGV